MSQSINLAKNIIFFYHQNCRDGFTAAWAAWKKFGSRATYIPMRHNDPVPKNLINKEIYFLDITYIGKNLERIIKQNKRVVIIDHHVTIKDELQKVHAHSYALNHSGATLAWKFFHKTKTPRFLKYVEEGDLWKIKSPHAKEILASIESKPFNFKVWDGIVKEIENPKTRGKYIEIGKSILEYEDKIIAKLSKNMETAIFETQRVGVINSPILESQLGNAIYKGKYKIGLVWHRRNGEIKVSLRSKNGDKTNVAKLAQKYGGGGHKAAAGFTLADGVKLPWKYIK